MIEIIPNWHPMLVHFTVGLLSASTFLFLARFLMKPGAFKTQAETAALWMLWLGAGFTVLTVAAGFYAFTTVGHDAPSHAAMKEHRNLGLPTAAVFLALAGYSFARFRKSKPLPGFFPWAMAAAAILLGVTAWHGAELVYRHGLGVMSLPEVEGEGHSHDAAEGGPAMTMNTDMSAPMQMAADLATPEGTVAAFHAALKHGDGAAAQALLDPAVLIFESGYVERSAAEYAGHHLPADMAFSGAMSQTVTSRTVEWVGEVAVVTSETRTQGTYKDKAYDLVGTETMTLRRSGEGWLITHIHWSSRPAEAK